MHILQLIPQLEVGGVERGVLDLAQGLIRRGHRVSVVSGGGALVEPLTTLGATHVTLPVHQKSPETLWRCVPALCRLIRDTGVELVHARSRVPAWIGYAAARRTGVPFVTTCHGFYRPHPASRVMTWGRLVIAPSTALARYLIDRFGVPAERLRVVPRGVNLSQFQFRPKTPSAQGPWRIGIVGRLSALKGHDVAIRALMLLIEQRMPVTLCVIGDAPAHKPQIRRQLEALAAQLGVERAVEWLGRRRDIPDVLASLDMVLVPSVYPESFGRSVVEAQAVGVPVVASRLGAFPELITHEQTGLLVEPNDPVAVAHAIRRMLQEPSLRERSVQGGRANVEARYTLDHMVEHTLAVYDEVVNRPRVLVWKLSAMGDVVLSTPSLRAVRRQFPRSSISVVTGRPVYEILAHCPYVDDVIVYDPTRKDRTLAGKWRFVRHLQRAAFAVSIDLQNNRLTHLMAWLAGIPVRIGYRRRWGGLLSRAVTLPKTPMNPIAHQHQLLQAAGISPNGAQMELWPSSEDQARADRLLRELGWDGKRPLIGVHPGASGRWRTKQWEPARWAALCDWLADHGYQPVVTGSADDQPLGQRLLGATSSSPLIAIGKTRVMELACMIRRCRAFVTTDSAPLHIAAAVGTPTVALFGPTDPARHVPPSAGVIVLKRDVFCSPCYSPRCRTITHACMKRIEVEDVMQAIGNFVEC